MQTGKIYICDDDEGTQRLLEKMLHTRGHRVEVFVQGLHLLQRLTEQDEDFPDLILVDVRMPDLDGLDVLRRVKAQHPSQQIVMMSAFGTVRSAVEAMKQGAHDFLLKPFTSSELYNLVDKLIEHNHLRTENRSLKAEIRRRFDPAQVIYRSPAFGRVYDLARKVAQSDASILISGESGVGKEVIASTIHHSSQRSDERFLTINCAALTDTLLESQLFGHIKGSFTGAVASHIGLIEEADRGTLFLDEIGDISPGLQAKLLRVLQEREFIPVGSTKVRHANVRFVAASNKNLEDEVKAGNFREDLYYRLNVVTLHVPPLRERPEDIPPLARYFVNRFAGRDQVNISHDALKLLTEYSWPGNVRELENVLEMAVILAEDGQISPQHLPTKLVNESLTPMVMPKKGMSLEDVERLYIEQVYRQTRFHKVRTAEILKVARRTLDRKLAQYHISKDSEQNASK